jgi:sugar phosphate isomerase/epimerase
MHRRTFLQTTAGAAMAAGLTQSLLALPSDQRYMKSIGLQLYTVRNQLAVNLDATIQAVADAGYEQVELMQVLDADDVLTAIRDRGLNVTSAFFDWQTIANPQGNGVPSFNSILDKAQQIDLKYLVFGYIGKGFRETADQFRRHATEANVAGEKCRAAGIQLCYHNHSFEFAPLADGHTGWDILANAFDRDLVKFEVDVFWAAIGGRDPLELMRGLPGQVAQVHLKDLKGGTEVEYDEGRVAADAFQEVGDGAIDMAEVLRVAAEIGVEQCHVEQDQSPDPIASIGQSMLYLRELEL